MRYSNNIWSGIKWSGMHGFNLSSNVVVMDGMDGWMAQLVGGIGYGMEQWNSAKYDEFTKANQTKAIGLSWINLKILSTFYFLSFFP